MSEPRFTKGPWYTISAGIIRAGGTEGDERPRRIVARVEGAMDNSCYMTGLTEEQANEKLIERCPELYRNAEENLLAFKNLWVYYSGIDLDGRSEDVKMVINAIMDGLKKRIDDTEALLKKARGEA